MACTCPWPGDLHYGLALGCEGNGGSSGQSCVVEFDGKEYQVEVELLEKTESYVHAMLSVDDGSLPASISPLTRSFIREKVAPDDRA